MFKIGHYYKIRDEFKNDERVIDHFSNEKINLNNPVKLLNSDVNTFGTKLSFEADKWLRGRWSDPEKSSKTISTIFEECHIPLYQEEIDV